jgi:hypothetical protein
MIAHRKIVTIDELRRDAKRGLYDSKAVEEAAEKSNNDYQPTTLEKEMNNAADDNEDREVLEKARIRVEMYECYLKADVNGDGMLEDAIVTVCNDVLLRAVENPYGRAPIFELVPFWDSYQVWSKLGLPEIIENVQDAHTALLKQMINGLGLSNNPKSLVDVSNVNTEDLDEDQQYIRVNGPPKDSFISIPTAGLNPQNFQMFEYLRGQLEEWTPMTRYNQGTDSSSLNKTASGINMIMTASQQRQEEIIRNFAETGISELFRFLIKLNQMYLDTQQVIRLQNDIIQFPPDDLEGDYDLSVDASSGIGARDSKVQVLTSYMREMWPAAMQIGAAGIEQFVTAGQKLLKLMGIEDADKYLFMPDPQQQMLMQLMAAMGGNPNGGAGQGAQPAQGVTGRPGAGGAGGIG